jgi:hypothetical protein
MRQILTHDWSRYDPNSAIVRTSALSAERINALQDLMNLEFVFIPLTLVYFAVPEYQ